MHACAWSELKSPSGVRNASVYGERVGYEFYFLFRVKKKKKIKKMLTTRHGAPSWYAFVVVGRTVRFILYRYGARAQPPYYYYYYIVYTFGVTCTVFFFST